MQINRFCVHWSKNYKGSCVDELAISFLNSKKKKMLNFFYFSCDEIASYTKLQEAFIISCSLGDGA